MNLTGSVQSSQDLTFRTQWWYRFKENLVSSYSTSRNLNVQVSKTTRDH